MYWKKIFGDALFTKVKKHLKGKKMSISSLVRISVEEYIKRQED